MVNSTIQIRYNNDCTDGINFWRAIIDGVEHKVAEVIINTKCKTTKDYLEDKKTFKWHITVKTKNFEIKDGVLTIN